MKERIGDSVKKKKKKKVKFNTPSRVTRLFVGDEGKKTRHILALRWGEAGG